MHPNTNGNGNGNGNEHRIESWADATEAKRFAEVLQTRKAGLIEEKDFKRFRLQHGIYGIRGLTDIQMIRLKIPFGRLTGEQMAKIAQIARTYSNGTAHITTRQNMQLYYVDLEKIPQALAEFAEVGLTTREASGNVVRNVTACPLAGVCASEVFDVTPYAEATARFFLRNPVAQNMPRKFKIAFSGCTTDCALSAIHDIGAIAVIKTEGKQVIKGFKLYVGGGLGASPKLAQLLEPFTPANRLLLTVEAIIRVFDRLGNRENRAQARMKFLIGALGIEKFRERVFAERTALWGAMPTYPTIDDDSAPRLIPGALPASLPVDTRNPALQQWIATNVVPQKQKGFYSVFIFLPGGDITTAQLIQLSAIARRYARNEVRTTITQNMVLRWVEEKNLETLFKILQPIGLAKPGAHRLGDVVSCPGADTCNLAITHSQRLAKELIRRLETTGDLALADDLQDIIIKISGCPNSCGHHHTAPIGLQGAAKKVNGQQVPYYTLLLGGHMDAENSTYGTPMMRLPARRVPDAIIKLVQEYRTQRQNGEAFLDWLQRLDTPNGALKRTIRALLSEFESLPQPEVSPELYVDWGQENGVFAVEIGEGECAT